MKSVSYPDALEILFSNRNKQYGAYFLRRHYARHLGQAMGIGFMLIGLFFLGVRLLSATRHVTTTASDTTVILSGPKEAPKEKARPPELPKAAIPPPASRPAERFVPPVVTNDDQAAPETEVRTQEELSLSRAETGVFDRAGDVEAAPSPDDRLTDINTGGNPYGTRTEEEVFEGFDVQKMPSFPGGERELLRYLVQEIRYPGPARENNISGPVVLSFVVNTDGSISQITVLKDPGGGCGKEAVRVVQSMPRWLPGEMNGRPVKVRFILPVRFELR